MRFLVDPEVILDVLLDRAPHVTAAAGLWAVVEQGWADGLLPAHGFIRIASMAHGKQKPASAQELLADLLAVFEAAPVDGRVLRKAATAPSPDFDDALTLAAADLHGCDAIVTREPDRLRSSRVRLIDPATATMLSRRRPNRWTRAATKTHLGKTAP